MLNMDKLREIQRSSRILAFSKAIIPEQPETRSRNIEKRTTVIALESFRIWKQFDPSKFINMKTGKPLGVKSNEDIWRVEK